MTISLDYIREHIPEIIEGVLWVCSIITFTIKTVKVGKTHSLIKMAFKENTDLYKKRDEKIRSDMKILSDETKRFAEEAKKQIEEYAEFEEIRSIPNLSKYAVVAVNDKIYVEKV